MARLAMAPLAYIEARLMFHDQAVICAAITALAVSMRQTTLSIVERSDRRPHHTGAARVLHVQVHLSLLS